jgi:hypothetical protein
MSGAESGARADFPALSDPSFLELAELWLGIPKAVKTDIMRLARQRERMKTPPTCSWMKMPRRRSKGL